MGFGGVIVEIFLKLPFSAVQQCEEWQPHEPARRDSVVHVQRL